MSGTDKFVSSFMLSNALDRLPMKKLISIALLILPACSGLNVYQKLSSGRVGCPPPEVGITDENRELGVLSWTATCRGAIFYCTSSTGVSSDTLCKEARR